MRENYKRIEKFFREFDLKHGEYPFYYEVIEALNVKQNTVEGYINQHVEDYPEEKRYNRLEHEILNIYYKCKSYDDIVKALKGNYASIYAAIQRLILRDVIDPKPKKKIKVRGGKEVKEYEEIMNDKHLYIQIVGDKHKGKSGYFYKSELLKAKSVCYVYDGTRLIEISVEKKHIKILKPEKLKGETA